MSQQSKSLHSARHARACLAAQAIAYGFFAACGNPITTAPQDAPVPRTGDQSLTSAPESAATSSGQGAGAGTPAAQGGMGGSSLGQAGRAGKQTIAADSGMHTPDTTANGGMRVREDRDDSDAGATVPNTTVPEPAASEPRFPVFATNGQPLSARDRVWTYVEFPDSRCRDGSRAGISLSLNSASKKLMIYLEGGVYCFDDDTCAINPANVDELLFNSAKTTITAGIFDRTNTRNPLRDWNFVYVPYCTGDAHAGTKATPTDVPNGPRGQYFAGHLNLQKFLQRIVPTFKDASDVLLTGMSAGGLAVQQNVVLVQRAFPQLKVRFIDDSGPPLSKVVIPECLQEKFRTLWGLDDSTLAYCGDSCPHKNDYLLDNGLFLAKTFGDRPSGFIDSSEDGLMMIFFGIGLRNCSGTFLVDSVPAATYRADLLAYRDKLKAFPNSGTFIPENDRHTWLRDNSFYTVSAGGVKLVDWFAKIVQGEAAGHVGP